MGPEDHHDLATGWAYLQFASMSGGFSLPKLVDVFSLHCIIYINNMDKQLLDFRKSKDSSRINSIQ